MINNYFVQIGRVQSLVEIEKVRNKSFYKLHFLERVYKFEKESHLNRFVKNDVVNVLFDLVNELETKQTNNYIKKLETKQSFLVDELDVFKKFVNEKKIKKRWLKFKESIIFNQAL